MALSADPEKQQRQLAALAEGRRIAKERRAEGLPTKRTEQAGSRRRVVKGGYPAPPAAQPAPPAAPPDRQPAPPDPQPAPPAARKRKVKHARIEEAPVKPARRDWLGAIGRIVGAD